MKKKIGLIALAALAVLVLLFIFAPTLAWILVGLVLLILALILFVPIGADIGFVGGVFSLAARVDGMALQLLPRKPEDPNKPKKEKPKKEKPKQAEKPKEETEAEPKAKKLDFTREELLELVKRAIKGLGKFGKLTVRRFMLHYVAAGEDPYNTAMTLAYVNAALCSLAPLCASAFHVKGDVDVWTDADFAADHMRLDTELSITLRLIQVVRAALAVAVGVLGVLIRRKKRLKQEAKRAKENPAPAAIEDKTDTTIPSDTKQDEERKDTHG